MAIESTRISVGNRLYSQLREGFIRSHPKYPLLLNMRKNQRADRKETAKFAEKLLKEALKKQGLKIETFTKLFEETKKNYTPYQKILEAENDAYKKLKPRLKQYPIYTNWLTNVRGIGEEISIKLLSIIRDIRRFQTPSSLRSYLGTVPGQRKKAKQQANFNPKNKGLMLGVIPRQFLMGNSQYRKVYDEHKLHYQKEHADWTKMKIHRYAIKPMMHRFIDDLWKAWYLSLNIKPPVNPYIATQPNHHLEPPLVLYSQAPRENHRGFASHCVSGNQNSWALAT